MNVDLLPHNQRTYANICRMYDEGIQRIAVVQPTGSGKSLLMAQLINDNPDSRFFILSTSHKINDQFKEKLDEEMLKRIECNIYCNMPNMKKEDMEVLQPDYILLDEMHRALAKEWSKGIQILLEMYPHAKVLGLSATPIRYLDRCRNVVEELFNGNLACDMSLSQAILDNILPMARYVCGVYSYEKDTESLNRKIEKSTNSDEEKKELLKEVKILKENLDKGNGVSDIFRKYIVTGNEKIVVFLKNIKHLRKMRPVIKKWFDDAGFSSVRIYEVHSKNTEKDKEFQAFKDDAEDGVIKICLSVSMVTEGLHGDISSVIMLRDTCSPNLYFQMIGRAFSCNKKTIPLIFDLVANSQFISGDVDNFPNELKGEIERRKKECEKENKKYEVGFDVDEFIVMDQFMDVVSGFKEIEGRLEGSWDLYVKALRQYKEREGDCDVPKKHVEIVDGVGVKLGQWIIGMRMAKNNTGTYSLTEEGERQLNQLKFIWNILKYKFENNIKSIAEYYKKFGKYPVCHSEDPQIKKLEKFLRREKSLMRNNHIIYPEWKKEMIDKYLPDFSCKYERDRLFDEFIIYAKLYKERYGHLNIKTSDIINGYKIGVKRDSLSRCESLSENQIKQAEDLGIYLGNKFQKQFNDTMELAKQAVNEGVIISNKNSKYKDQNLYIWLLGTIKKKYKKGELSIEEIQVVEKLVGKSLNNLYCGKKELPKVGVIDVAESKKVGIFESRNKAVKVMRKKYNIKISNTAIRNRLTGKITTPYEGRFMFYRVDENEKVTN